MKALVIGYGSIGERHARVLKQIGFEVSIVSRRGMGGSHQTYRSLSEAGGPFDYIIVADETARHEETLASLAAHGHAGSVLVEKPLFAKKASIPDNHFRRAGVGYNLRFHPVVRALRAELVGRTAQMVNMYVGQWLGDWRPGRDVAATYSASRLGGGGALRDLSHELDLVTWLFGPWRRVSALGGRLGSVTRDSDDGWAILLECERCPVVSMQLNCLDRETRRSSTVHVDGDTLHADLVANTLSFRRQTQAFPSDRDVAYLAMHRAVIDGGKDVCTLDEGLRTVELIEAIERSAHERSWIDRAAA